MTPEEIQAMNPGRELDAEVALAVMGFKEITIVGKHYFTDPIDTSLKIYSSDLNAAWEVVERFKNEGYLFSLKNLVGGKYEFTLTDWGRKCDVFSRQGETAPEAICKAALLAVLGEAGA